MLSLYASGRITGVVLDSGEGITYATSFFDGFALHHSVERLCLGGGHITAYLMKTLAKSLHNSNSISLKDIARDVKEKLSYVSTDFELENAVYNSKWVKKKAYKLPDGQILKI